MNAPGKGMLIGAGVALLIFGIIGLISPFVFGMSFRAVSTIMLVASIAYVIFGIEALVYCGDPNKTGMLQAQGGVLLGYEIFALFFFTPHVGGFSILSFIGPGLAILYIVGAVKNKNAVPFRNYTSVKKCRQCSATYAISNIACPHCGSSLCEEIRDNSGTNNSVSPNPVTSNVGDTWFCKECDTVNPLTASICKDCGCYK